MMGIEQTLRLKFPMMIEKLCQGQKNIDLEEHVYRRYMRSITKK